MDDSFSHLASLESTASAVFPLSSCRLAGCSTISHTSHHTRETHRINNSRRTSALTSNGLSLSRQQSKENCWSILSRTHSPLASLLVRAVRSFATGVSVMRMCLTFFLQRLAVWDGDCCHLAVLPKTTIEIGMKVKRNPTAQSDLNKGCAPMGLHLVLCWCCCCCVKM